MHRGRPGYGREEAEIDGVVAEAFVERKERGLVVGTAGAHAGRPAVGEHHVALPLAGYSAIRVTLNHGPTGGIEENLHAVEDAAGRRRTQ